MKKEKVLVFGCFDGFHHGHSRLVERAANHGEVIVGVFSDKCMITEKNKSPPQ